MSQETVTTVAKSEKAVKPKKLVTSEFGECSIDNDSDFSANYAPVYLPRIGSKFWMFIGAPVCKTVEDIFCETKHGNIFQVGIKFLGDKKFRTFDSTKMFETKIELLEAAFPDEETE